MSFIKNKINRVSNRSYKSKKLNELELKNIINVINNSPTSINGQSFSAIIIDDQDIKNEISKLNWNQKHIVECSVFILFIADNNRINVSAKINNLELPEMNKEIEGLIVGIVDATIAAEGAASAAQSMDLGTCYIGGVRTYSDKLIKILDLPKYTYPVVGLTIGYKDKIEEHKPKINKVYLNKYKLLDSEINEYDKKMVKYYEERNENRNYSLSSIEMYNKFKELKVFDKQVETIKKQGFKI